ncbi:MULTISPECIES: FAD-dependent monooxygenase [Mycobacteriales]|uniref:FAD-dependent monooxygenase n=2 Tax=Gordonia rubripertincta TaxID=36822 RepID=A0AAW6RGU9_GORRU|nr:FAD-dependent monooxygenase [Gordonia rubripertincta]MDG6783237.1 FAD-dependent monooxygenase [Gordonia rubripertincta]NKY62980.1 FAD-binding protein [Gordonia rubripertincta]GAB87145.1 putative oxidoreductase [Gordonia rubripertincta NBRC 101908]
MKIATQANGSVHDHPLDVLIVGGGIGGLATALAVARAGRRVHLVEQAAEFSEIGAGLQLGPNAMRAFDQLGVYESIAAKAVFPERALIRDAVTGELLTTLQLGARCVKHFGYPYVVAHRSDILAALLEACRAEPRITLENNRTVVSADDTGDEARVQFTDGAIYRAATLIGADGIKSRVRRIFDTTEPTFSGQIAYRGAIDIADVPGDVSGDEVLLWIGPRVHLIQYPVRSGTMYNQVAVYDRPAGQTEPIGHLDEFDAAFAITCPEVQRAAQQIDKTRYWPVCDRTPLHTWSGQHAVLIGDAAHAMLQYLGQGACQALEDALALGDALGEHHDEPQVAFKKYEIARVERATRCQEVARPWGALWHTNDPTLLALRNRVFRLRAADDYSDVEWLYADPTATSDTAPTSTLKDPL